MTRLILFDLDGTLIDSRLDLAASANAALAKVGRPALPVETVARFVGNGARTLVSKALGEAHQDKLNDALAAFFAYYGEHLVASTTLYPGIEAMLKALPGPRVVCTNKPGRFARPICEQFGIAPLFGAIHGEGDMPARKPDPEGALALCEQFGVKPQHARFVGDSRIDTATARNAGIPFIGVTWGYGTVEEMRAAGGTHFVESAEALTQALLE